MFARDELHLDTLLLTEKELRAARSQVQELAYLKWEAAGRPPDESRSEEFWQEAELEWIEYYYVPDR